MVLVVVSGGSGLLASRISTDNDSNNSNGGNNNNDGDLDTENFDHLKELNSPTINNALKNLSAKRYLKIIMVWVIWWE